MYKIGVVLSGCAGKGAYEIGCMQAITEYFGIDSIKCVSSASLGSLIGHSFGLGREKQLEEAFLEMDSGKQGRNILAFPSNKKILGRINSLIEGEENPCYEHYTSVWNFSRSKVEYIPFHTLDEEKLKKYMLAAISVPIFTKGVTVDNCRLFDGAFLDNIPVYPIKDKDLDFIFCVYFDNYRYVFENKEFDKKIIKLYDFPNRKMLELMLYNVGSFAQMKTYAYEYTKKVINNIFENHNNNIYEAIRQHDSLNKAVYTPRLTADVVLNNINAVTKRYSKRQSILKKEDN